MSTYPSTLPVPVAEQHDPRRRVFETDLPGLPGYSAKERDFSATLDISFFFTAEQAAVFNSWWSDELGEGGLWFNCSWPSIRPGGMICQFLTEPVMDHVRMGAHRVSATVQVRGTSLAIVNCTRDEYYPGDSGSSPHTILSLHGESFVDASSDPKPLVNNGVTITDVVSKFRRYSLSFNGSNSRINVGTHADFQFGTGAFTAEAFVRPTAHGVDRIIVGKDWTYGVSYPAWGMGVTPAGLLYANIGTGAYTGMLAIGGTVPLDSWSHVVFMRVGSSVCLFVEGELTATGTSFQNITNAYEGSLGVVVGAGVNVAAPFSGCMSDLRVTRGAGRYPPSFTVPASTFGDNVTDDPSFNSVVLLVHGASSFADSSSYARTTTAAGLVSISSTQSKFGGSSIYAASTGFGAYAVQWASSSDFDLSSSNSTIEMWAYELPGSYGSLLARRPGGLPNGWAFTVANLRANVNGAWSDDQMAWPRPSQNEWHHYALVVTGSTILVFVDGRLVGAKRGVTSIDDQPRPLCLGQADDASENKFLGYIADLRFTKVARYLAAFTPPPLTFCDRA